MADSGEPMTENQQLPEGELYGEEVPTFNTAGPCIPQRHYMLPPEPRVPGALYLVDFDEYFVIHAPRQTGKTTVLEALARDINAAGQRVALVFSCEQAAPAGDNYDAAIDALLATITDEARARAGTGADATFSLAGRTTGGSPAAWADGVVPVVPVADRAPH